MANAGMQVKHMTTFMWGNMKQMMKTRGKKSRNNTQQYPLNTLVFTGVIHHQWDDPLRTTPKSD